MPAPLHSGAEHGGVDLELLRDAERRLGQLELDADQGVLAAAHPRPRAALAGVLAEERVHDVGEREALARSPTPPPAAERVAAEVVHLALLGVAQHVVGAA